MALPSSPLPVVIIGAGPVGLAAAAHVRERGLTPLVFEAGADIAAGIRRWSHVRLFSPWEYAIDKAAERLLRAQGWESQDPTAFPTGSELIQHYLEPLARTPELAPHIHTGARVIGVSRLGRDRMKSAERDSTPFVVRIDRAGQEDEVIAQAVIDASGTIDSPNPLGASGLFAIGERAAREQIYYGVPDVLGRERDRYAQRRVLVVGSGHSAFNVLTDLARLAHAEPGTTIQWAIRRASLARVLGGGENDQLKERGKLGQRVRGLIEDGVVALATDFHLDRLTRSSAGWIAHSGDTSLAAVDEIVATTGFRPDLSLLAEVRLDLDPATQSPSALAPLIDPNLHSCGTVRPHGAEELKQPDANLYIVGMKSYGRAPTFLMLTGYEQVRSVAAAIAGDWEAARRVELVLPETGVCSTDFDDAGAGCGSSCSATTTEGPSCSIAAANDVVVASACCGGPASADIDACCVKDAEAKASGQPGCGCDEPVAVAVAPAAPRAASCCH